MRRHLVFRSHTGPGSRDDPELEEIQERIENIADEISESKKKKGDADRLLKSLCLDFKCNSI